MDFPNWQMHRGYWKQGIRENTLEAFKRAKVAGIKMVELDVQLSRDGVPHVFHDYDLKRFFHIEKRLDQVSSEDLNGLNIPRLVDVMQSNQVPPFLNVEIKSIDLFCYRIAQKICNVVAENLNNKTVLFSSFNPMCLYWTKRFLPEIPRALIVGNTRDLLSWKFRCSVALSQPQYINANYRLIDDQRSREVLVSYALPIMVWTVNDTDKADKYLSRGAKSVISDILPSVKSNT